MTTIRDILDTMDYGPAREDSGIVTQWLKRHDGGFGHFIDGTFTKPGATSDVSNPATGAVIARVT